ncbi:hypothetical protein [Ferroplasma sp.]|uniref:hypothetical protein n=1 Tax=Ferroplasma sp. TaxID=2591003 RepID=UPI00307E59C2
MIESESKEKLQRIIMNEGATVLILSAFVAFGLFGYLNIYAIIMETVLLLSAFILLLLSNLNGKFKFNFLYLQIFVYSSMLLADMAVILIIHNMVLKFLLIIIATISLLFASYKFYKDPDSYDFIKNRKVPVRLLYIVIASAFLLIVSVIAVVAVFEPTDEFLIDLYSAMKFMQGVNPYNPATTAGVFIYFKKFNLDLNVTPTMYGKDITLLGYPALAFIIYIPYIYIGKFANLIISIIAFIPFILIYKKFSDKKIALYAMFALLINIIFLYSAAFSLIGLVWLVFLMASYYFRKNTLYSGIFFGLSLSAKQFPALIFPFLFYMIYREKGIIEAIKWTLYAFLIFILINGYFIIKSPVLYFKDILSPETEKLIGIGFGPSQLSFLNFVHITPEFFTILMILSIILFFVIYIKHYNTLKFSLFVFPILILLFNYRLLITYITFWPILSLISIEDIDYKRKLKINKKALKRYAVYAVAILIAILVVGAYFGSHNEEKVKINNMQINTVHGKVEKIIVSVTYTGNVPENIYFRGIINETNYNGLLFNYSGNKIMPGTSNIILYPVRGETIPDNITIDIIAYNGTIQGSSAYTINGWKVKPYHDLLYNPPQNKLSLNQSLP